MTKTTTSVDAGSPTYMAERRIAYRLIRQADEAAAAIATAPLYLHGGFDENGDVIPIENMQPFDDLEEAVQAVRANPLAVSILAAQGRETVGDTYI